MKVIIKGKEVKVEYVLSYKKTGEPEITKEFEDIKDIEFKTLENTDMTFSKGDLIHLDETISIKVLSVRKTLDNIIYIYTDAKTYIEDAENKSFIETLYNKSYEKYAKNLLKQYPNVFNILKVMGKENLSSKEIVEAIKSFNGLQNDFFTK